MVSLILYVTEHCSLCDEAFALLGSMPELAGCSLQLVDIEGVLDADDAQFAELAPRLPVLALAATEDLSAAANKVLDWPFTAAQVLKLSHQQ